MSLNFSSLCILVVGDVMLDEYVSTSVSRISPEAPVPIATVCERWHVAGGAANVARNLAQLGCQVFLTGLCGEDPAGDMLARLLIEEDVKNYMHVVRSGVTIQKTRIIAQHQQMLRIDYERADLLTQEQYKALLCILTERISHCHAVILSDYAKGVLCRLPDGACLAQDTVALCAAQGIPIFVDPKGADWDRYNGVDCVTPNTLECSLAAGHPCEQRADLEHCVSLLQKTFALQRLLVTRGSKGMALFDAQGDALYVKAKAKEVIDVSGAGDTVIAVLAACRTLGLEWDAAAHMANLAAGVVVCKAGTSPITKAEFDSLLEPGAASPKIVTLPQLMNMVCAWRRSGSSIIFTNGCFDLLHKGHLQLINEAAAQGDRLIVATNTDRSVQRLKGTTRPVQDENSRAMLLAALSNVDAVILFDEETPLSLIKSIMPDVLVKGGDYAVQSVVGSDVVTANGGKVHLVNLVEGASTTGLLSRIKQLSGKGNEACT